MDAAISFVYRSAFFEPVICISDGYIDFALLLGSRLEFRVLNDESSLLHSLRVFVMSVAPQTDQFLRDVPTSKALRQAIHRCA